MRKLLSVCIGASIVLHIAVLCLFFSSPLLLHHSLLSLFGLSSPTPQVLGEEIAADNQDKNALLEEAFDQILVLSPHLQQPLDMVETPRGTPLAPLHEEEIAHVQPTQPDENLLSDLPFLATQTEIPEYRDSEEADLLAAAPVEAMPSPQLQIDIPLREPHLSALPQDTDFVDDAPKSSVTLAATLEEADSLRLIPGKIQAEVNLGKVGSAPLLPKLEQAPFDEEYASSSLFVPESPNSFRENQGLAWGTGLPDIGQYEFPVEAQAQSWNDDFAADVVFAPHPDGKGYIFSVAMRPNFDLGQYGLKQNIYFILDRSSSVQKHRFSVFKRATIKALASMQHGDAFNILVIDKKITRLSPKNLPVTLKNIQTAEEFLEKQESGGLFTAGDVYGSLEKILAFVPDDHEAHTAILLTDGKTQHSSERKQNILKNWIVKNDGKVALYAAAIGRDNDLLTLDLFSSLSGGKLLYSDTHAAFPRKLAKLILDLKDPVAMDIVVKTTPHNPHSHIEFYSPGVHRPALYGHQPYVLVGQIDNPCSFELLLQGRHREDWVAIKKTISFYEGSKGDKSLENQWLTEKASLHYANFLREGKGQELREAKEIFQLTRSELAFE
ncbi:MAG: VWA domain-containing protein [Verrucomicrobia bacterium]|nr:VWA domain-containing protein [Verrucomicrobiota bacterium]